MTHLLALYAEAAQEGVVEPECEQRVGQLAEELLHKARHVERVSCWDEVPASLDTLLKDTRDMTL